MRKSIKRALAVLLSVVLVFSSIVFVPTGVQTKVMADEIISVVTDFTYDFAYRTPGYADGTIRISATEDGVYKVFWGDEEGNKLTKNGYEYSYLARVIVKDGVGAYNIVSDYTVIPEDAKTVLVYKKDVKQYEYTIPTERLFVPTGEGYTFGSLSDFHYGRFITNEVDDAVKSVDNALAFMDSIGVEFIGVTGDLTTEGEQESLDKLNAELAKYPNLTLLSVVGNHDSRTTVSTSDKTKLDTSLDRWYNSVTNTYFTVNEDGTFTSNLDEKYTIESIGPSFTTEYREVEEGEILTKEIPALDFIVTEGNNAFIFFNQISKTGTTFDTDKLVTTEQMDWLAEQFEIHKDKNVFMYTHAYLPVNTVNGDVVDNDNCVGDLKNEGGYSYDIDFKDEVTTTDGRNLLALFKQYGNVTMFSGHSHWQYAMQEHNSILNIDKVSDGQGATLVHLSSVTEPRYIGTNDGHRTDLNGQASEGMTVTIYDDCIVYNAVDLYNSQYEAYATYIVPLGEESIYEPVADTTYVPATDVISGDEYLGLEDMTLTQILKSTYNLMYGAAYTYTSKGEENTDGALTDGTATGTAFTCTKPNKKSDQVLTVTLDGVQEVSNLKSFMIYFVNGLTDCSDFNIQLSLDGETWETVGTYTEITYATNELPVDTSALTLTQYKYIKLNLCGGVKAYGYQIKEFAAIGYERNTTPNTAGSSSSMVEGVIDEEDFLDTDYNLIYGAEYTQSSVGGENTAGVLTDGKTSSGFMNTERNSSAKKQEFVIDMGKGNTQPVNNIDYLLLYNQNELTNVTYFTVSISLDGETYETIGDYKNVDLDTTHFDVDLSTVTLEEFRYVKLNFTNGNTDYGYQIKEFAVIGVNPIEYPEILDQSTDVTSSEKNYALNKDVYVSSTYANEGKDPIVLTDGKTDAYWSSDWDATRTSDYVVVDLGEEVDVYTIGKILVNYKDAATFCTDYKIEVSKTFDVENPDEGFYEVTRTKAMSWEILQKRADTNGYVVTDVTDVVPDMIRYVKINMSGHANYGFQVKEIAIIKNDKVSIATCSINVLNAPYVVTGSPIEPDYSVLDSKGKQLEKDVDYTVEFSNNVSPTDEAEIIITGIGKYYGVITGYFSIISPEPSTSGETTTEEPSSSDLPSDNETTTIVPTTEKQTTINPATEKTTTVAPTTARVKKPAKVGLRKIKKLSLKKAKVTWKKVKGVRGYQIRYTTSRKMKKAKYKLIKKNTSKYIIKKLRRKKYYVQVRAYKIVNKRKIYGRWSNKKKLNMKK